MHMTLKKAEQEMDIKTNRIWLALEAELKLETAQERADSEERAKAIAAKDEELAGLRKRFAGDTPTAKEDVASEQMMTEGVPPSSALPSQPELRRRLLDTPRTRVADDRGRELWYR